MFCRGVLNDFRKYSLFACVGFLLIYLAFYFNERDRLSALGRRRASPTKRTTRPPENNVYIPSETHTDPTQPVSVLLLTYRRSGSSLTGDILQHSKEAFYVYEPFRSLGRENASTFTLVYANGTERTPPFSFQKETYNALYNWFTCNISSLPNIGLLDIFLNKGLKSRMFPLCYRKEIRQGKEQKLAIRMCARQLQDICERSPFRILKTVRLQLHDIRNLLEDLPNLKIIHLVRDPRATLSSQAKLGMCPPSKGGKPWCTSKFCTTLENNVLAEERLMKMYPNRIMPILYKDIAKHPLDIAKKMYDFIGADFNEEAKKLIYRLTMAGNEDDCAICTTRSNSTEHIDEWKTRMKPEFIKFVNERCNYVIKRYNFDEFPGT